MGRPDAFDLVNQGVANLAALGKRPIGDLIIKSDTWMHLADIVEYWAGRGIQTFNLWLVSLSDRNKDNLASLLPVSTMRDGIVAAFERGLDQVERVTSLGTIADGLDVPGAHEAVGREATDIHHLPRKREIAFAGIVPVRSQLNIRPESEEAVVQQRPDRVLHWRRTLQRPDLG
jgi:hypothetical protein